MKRFKLSFLYGLIIILTTPFHHGLENLIIKLGMTNLVRYFFLGIILALFLIAFFKCITAGKIQEMAALALAVLILSLLLFQKKVFPFRVDFSLLFHVVAFFFMGFIIFKENRKLFSFSPFIILAAMAVVFELIQLALPGRAFNINDIWLNGIAGFCGFLVGYY